MTVRQPISNENQFSTTESSILLKSFIVGFIACIVTVSILVFTVKKIESHLSTPGTTIYTANK